MPVLEHHNPAGSPKKKKGGIAGRRFHVNNEGRVMECKATKQACDFSTNPHFTSEKEAYEYAERQARVEQQKHSQQVKERFSSVGMDFNTQRFEQLTNEQQGVIMWMVESQKGGLPARQALKKYKLSPIRASVLANSLIESGVVASVSKNLAETLSSQIEHRLEERESTSPSLFDKIENHPFATPKQKTQEPKKERINPFREKTPEEKERARQEMITQKRLHDMENKREARNAMARFRRRFNPQEREEMANAVNLDMYRRRTSRDSRGYHRYYDEPEMSIRTDIYYKYNMSVEDVKLAALQKATHGLRGEKRIEAVNDISHSLHLLDPSKLNGPYTSTDGYTSWILPSTRGWRIAD